MPLLLSTSQSCLVSLIPRIPGPLSLCSSPTQAAYDFGLELLERQEAGLALPRLEEALQGSLAQMESCRSNCEGPEEQQEAEEEEEGARSQGGLYEAIAGKGRGPFAYRRGWMLRSSRHKPGGPRVFHRTLDSGPAVPAALCGRHSHTSWSQSPCP